MSVDVSLARRRREKLASAAASLDLPFLPLISLPETPENDQSPLPKDDGGGTSPPMAESDLKTRVDWLYTLIPWLIGLMVTLFVAIMVATATTNGRIDKGSELSSSLNREVGQVSAKIDETNRRLDRIEAKLDALATNRKGL